MRLIPGKTKVKIELFKGIGIGDIVVVVLGCGLVTLMLLSTIPGRFYIAIVIAVLTGGMVFRLDKEPTYILLLQLLKYASYQKYFSRAFSDRQLLAKGQGTEMKEYLEGEEGEEEETEVFLSDKERKKALKALLKEENRILKSKQSTDEEKNAVWLARAKRSEEKKKRKRENKANKHEEQFVDEITPFTGISDGFIEYGGKYYGAIIEIDPVEFRFFSKYRRNNAIEECFGKILRSVKGEYAFNIIKIERPVIYDKYLDREYERLDELKASFEKGFLTEEELKARVEIQYDRIETMRRICYDEKVILPHYYVALFESDKRQLAVAANGALASLTKAELVVRRITDERELAVFLKYTNSLDFEERDVDRLDPEDLVAWAIPEELAFRVRTVTVNGIVTHQMRVTDYPNLVGDAWIAGVMSIPGTKVVVKASAMDRAKAIRTIDRSLQELRGQYNATSVDSKLIELQTHIETLSRLLVTLQHDNEALLTVNIYVTLYDAVLTSERAGEEDEHVKNSQLPVIADMKKSIRHSWSEAGMRMSGMDFAQLQAYIGSQVSAYDPMKKDGRGIPANTIAAMYPWIYSHISDEGGVRLGESEGVPVFIDFFRRDSERVNSNMVIIGKSGSGKSYGTKSLLVNMAAEDAKIFILDPENEYTELAHNLGGRIINVGNARYGRLNPFHIITALEDDESGTENEGGSFSTHLQFLEEFFRQILPDVDKEALEYLNTLVERTYTNKGITIETDLSVLSPSDYPIFDDLYDVVLEEFERTGNEYLRTMLQTLVNYVAKFATGGRNANIWNGPSSITTDENFSVFNFQSLLANRNTTIANAQMLLVLKYIDNEIIKNRDYNKKYGLNRKIVVVIDEAHVFIDTKFPVALDFMFQLAKRIRKYNGMQIVITQNIKDFVGSEEIARKSTAIINACQYSFIFSLSPNDMDDLCRLYEKAGGINEMEQEQILAAPRGQVFTVMSPASRSSFTIGVSDTMVDVFERVDHVNGYFTGEEGEKNWEDYIGDSRLEHEQNLAERRIAEKVTGIIEEEKTSGLSFTEITVEEAEALAAKDAPSEEDGLTLMEDEKLDELLRRMEPSESSGGISFSEVTAEEFESQTAREEAQDRAADVQPEVSVAQQPAASMPAFDMDELISQIKEQVRAEILQEIAPVALAQAVSPAPATPVAPMPQAAQPAAQEPYSNEPEASYQPQPEEEYSNEPDETYEMEPEAAYEPETGYAAEPESGTEYATGQEETYEEEAPAEEPSWEDDFEASFDIMAILDEQMESYSEMSIVDRMEEIDVYTMEVTLEELAAHNKSYGAQSR